MTLKLVFVLLFVSVTGERFVYPKVQECSTSDDEVLSIANDTQLSLCFCLHDEPACSEPLSISTFPARPFNISVVALDPAGAMIPTTVVVENYPDTMEVSISAACTNITLQVKKIADGISTPDISAWLKGCKEEMIHARVNLKGCPKGFILGNNGSCGCHKKLTDLVHMKCDLQSGFINKTVHREWIRPVFNDINGLYVGIIWSSACPSRYCKPAFVMMDFASNDTDNQCNENRTGILCGKCTPTTSLTLNSLQCKECEYAFLGLLAIFALAGVGFIIFLLALDMTVASGTLNGVILYANVVSIYRDTFFPSEAPFNPFQVFNSWLNLDLGISICFYDGLDANQYFGLQYVFPLYLCFLIGIIIFVSKCSIRVRKFLSKTDPIAVLATVVLMSYTKILEVAVEVLTFANLNNSTGQGRMVWSFDGNIDYLKGCHLIHAVVAICVVAFLVLPYIFFLTFGYHFEKGCFKKMPLFLKAYYVPFKRNSQHWSGLMLVVRICLLLGSVASNSDIFTVPLFFMVVFSVAFLSKGVYENSWLDILEFSFLLNICIFSAGTYYIKTYKGNQAILSFVCLGVAFFEFVGIVCYHCYLRLKICLAIRKKRAPYDIDYQEQQVLAKTSFHFREPLLDTKESYQTFV